MHDESATVQLVIDTALAKAAAHSERSLIFASAEAFQEDAMERRGTILDADDLSDMHVSDLRNQFGRFLKVHAQFLRSPTLLTGTDKPRILVKIPASR